MTRLAVTLLSLSFLLTGCYTVTLAPGAVGNVVDVDTGNAIRGAHITRSELPITTVTSDKGGAFKLPPHVHTQIMFMYVRNPESLPGSFLVHADGYATNELHGIATSRTRWHVDLGKVLLRRK